MLQWLVEHYSCMYRRLYRIAHLGRKKRSSPWQVCNRLKCCLLKRKMGVPPRCLKPPQANSVTWGHYLEVKKAIRPLYEVNISCRNSYFLLIISHVLLQALLGAFDTVIECPFRIMDEFDVYMDDTTRRLVCACTCSDFMVYKFAHRYEHFLRL